MSKNFNKSVIAAPLGLVLLIGMTASPVRAQLVTADPTVETQTTLQYILSQAEFAWTKAQDYIKEGQTEWATAVEAEGKYLQTKIAAMTADTTNTNERTNVNVATAQRIAVDNDMPTNYSACHIAQGAAAESELGRINAAVSQALANGGANRPSDVVAQIKDIKAGVDNGLAPCSGISQTESSVHIAMGCTPKWGGRWERADYTEAALFSNLQIPVPPNFVLPTNGVYQQIPVVTSEKYMPFLAALRFCQRISARLPAAPQASNSKLPVDAVKIDAYGDMLAATSAAYETCTSFLVERMQYGNNIASAYSDAHLLQITQCSADATIGYIDGTPSYTFADGSTGTCETDGRSTLQAQHDRAYRNATKAYHAVFTVGLDRQSIGRENASLPTEQLEFNNRLNDERRLLNSALSQAAAAQKVYTSIPLSSPIAQ